MRERYSSTKWGVCSYLARVRCGADLLAAGTDTLQGTRACARSHLLLPVKALPLVPGVCGQFSVSLNHALVCSRGGTRLSFNLGCTAWPLSEARFYGSENGHTFFQVWISFQHFILYTLLSWSIPENSFNVSFYFAGIPFSVSSSFSSPPLSSCMSMGPPARSSWLHTRRAEWGGVSVPTLSYFL